MIDWEGVASAIVKEVDYDIWKEIDADYGWEDLGRLAKRVADDGERDE